MSVGKADAPFGSEGGFRTPVLRWIKAETSGADKVGCSVAEACRGSGMSFASIMVSVDLAGHAAERIKIATRLADDFGARLIGVAAKKLDHAAAPVRPMGANPCFLPESLERTKRELAKSQELFREAMQGHDRIEWRSNLASPLDYLVDQVRAADLIIVNRSRFPGGRLVWVRPPRIASRPRHNSALRPRREGRYRWVRAAGGD